MSSRQKYKRFKLRSNSPVTSEEIWDMPLTDNNKMIRNKQCIKKVGNGYNHEQTTDSTKQLVCKSKTIKQACKADS